MSDKDGNEIDPAGVSRRNIKLRAKSLWPDFVPTEGEVPPLTILREQASVLGLKLKNLIEADVETSTTDYGRFLRHTLFLIAPVLNFYRYRMLDVEHPATEFYPAAIKIPTDDPANSTREIQVADEQQFKDGLREIFGSAEVKRVIENLLAQSLGAGVEG